MYQEKQNDCFVEALRRTEGMRMELKEGLRL
jgi:hypothetical protein